MRTILIVEDDLRNVRILSRYLTSREGLAVKHTESIEEVIQIAMAREVDLVIMDVSLSHSVYQGKPVDGIQITQLLKRNPETASLPIVLVTAHAMQGDRERLLQQSGADGYISKPVLDYQAFIDQIMALLSEHDT
jgi:CheY-like chemotaxis protein